MISFAFRSNETSFVRIWFLINCCVSVLPPVRDAEFVNSCKTARKVAFGTTPSC